jgi:hypothetical protein
MGAVALLVLWGIYRFDGGMIEVGGMRLWLPLRFYLQNLVGTLGGLLEEARPTFLLGQVSTGSTWSYFPVAILYKTPLPLLLMVAGGVAALVRYGGGRRQAVLWAPTLLWILLAMTGVITVGYRHLLPVLPLCALLAGNAVRWVRLPERIWPAAAISAALASLVVSTVAFFPHHDSYSNALAGRWTRWSTILVDSNLDWGQDLPALAALQEELGIERLNLGYFGQAVPEAYGVRYSPLPGFLRFMGGREPAAFNPLAPEPGWYAISATALRLGTYTVGETELFAYFRALKPLARAGYSIALYQVAPESERRPPLLVTGEPAWRLDAAALLPDNAPVQVKWRQHEGSAIVPRGEALPAPDFDASLRVEPQADFGGVFVLEEAAFERSDLQPGETMAGLLVWRRGSAAMPMPAPTRGEAISAFLHVVDAADAERRVAQFDGWEVALRGLEEGDRIVQRVELTIGEDAAPGRYTLLAGLYSPQDGQRLPLLGDTPGDVAEVGALTVLPGR